MIKKLPTRDVPGAATEAIFLKTLDGVEFEDDLIRLCGSVSAFFTPEMCNKTLVACS